MTLLTTDYCLLVSGKIKVDTLKDTFYGFLREEFDLIRRRDTGEKKEAIRKRRIVNRLYFEEGYSKSEIARQEDVSRDFVIEWTQSPNQDVTKDDRGWPKGRRRKWDDVIEERIQTIREELEEDPDQPYFGATAVQTEYRRRYPDEEVPPVRTIGEILSDLGLTKTTQNGSSKGAAEYLCYPEHTIYEALGDRVLEADFVGEKFLEGQTEPLNFLGYSFKKDPRLRHYERIEGETADAFIEETKRFFDRFEVPDLIKVDNAAAMIGTMSGKRSISRVMKFLWEHEVHPVYAVPRRPFTQASIEGSNSVFSRKFWNNQTFESEEHVDERLDVFNEASRRYLGYEPPDQQKETEKDFEPIAYFTRQVRDQDDGRKGTINVLNEPIELPEAYINYFVLAEWNLNDEELLIRFEQNEESQVINRLDFPINERSKEKCSALLN